MSNVSVATQITLGQAIDEIRERTNTISEEESELGRIPLANMLHDAIILSRAAQVKESLDFLRNFYWTESTVTEASNLIDISTVDIWWEAAGIKDMTLYDATHGLAKMMTQAEFANIKTIYSIAMMVDFFIAYVANITATNAKFQIRTYRGTNTVTAGTLTLGYPRNPWKRLLVTDLLDCTEELARMAIEATIKMVNDRGKAA